MLYLAAWLTYDTAAASRFPPPLRFPTTVKWQVHALEMFSQCPLYGSYWLRLWLLSFWHPFLQWSGWASLFAGEEHLKGIWVWARCMPSSLVSRGLTKLWVGQVALRSPTNKHALDLLFHWTIKATRNEFLYWVQGAPSLICTFLDWDSRPTGSSLQARPGWLLFKLLCHRQSSLLVTRSFLSSPCTIFDPTDVCHLRRRLIIEFVFCKVLAWMYKLFCWFQFSSVQLRIILCWL